jgi:hypothetical protein
LIASSLPRNDTGAIAGRFRPPQNLFFNRMSSAQLPTLEPQKVRLAEVFQ